VAVGDWPTVEGSMPASRRYRQAMPMGNSVVFNLVAALGRRNSGSSFGVCAGPPPPPGSDPIVAPCGSGLQPRAQILKKPDCVAIRDQTLHAIDVVMSIRKICF